MMLRPRSIVEGRLDPERLRLYDADLLYTEGNHETRLTLADRRLVSASCWWDPSYGSPSKGDASVVAVVFTDDQGGYWLHGLRYLQHDPSLADAVDEATQLCRQVAAFARDLYLPAVSLETNGLGRFLPGLLRQELRALDVACAVIERSSSQGQGSSDRRRVRRGSGGRPTRRASQRLDNTLHRGDARVAARRTRAR